MVTKRGDLAVLWMQLEWALPLLRTIWGWVVWNNLQLLVWLIGFGGRYVLFRRGEVITFCPQVQVVFFSGLPVIKLVSDSCVYFSKETGLRRETAQIIYYIHCPQK